jgi:sugar phosphate isomerase/epimerase
MNKHISRRRILGLAIAGSASLALRSAGAVRAAPAGNDRFPFFAMDTGLRGPDVPTLEDKVKLLHDLGYWGIDYTLNHDELPRLLELLDKYGIELACVYLSPALEDKPDPRLAESVRQMKGRPTRIEMAIRSSRFKPDDPAGDKDALHMIHRVSDMAADTGPVVSIYPHTGLWTQRVQDGVRLAAASGRKNVGANFNLVHWAWVKQDQPLEKVLQQSLPHLFAITINGLDGRNIVPLDQGDYDVVAFIKLVKNIDYRGPVGLQGYGIPGPSRQSLARSMKKWREIMSSLHP